MCRMEPYLAQSAPVAWSERRNSKERGIAPVCGVGDIFKGTQPCLRAMNEVAA